MWVLGVVAGEDRTTMKPDGARLLAERLHAGDYEEDGTPLLEHVRRVARRVDAHAQPVAWLHEVLEWTAVAEHELLTEGLDIDELRALRLMHGAHGARSDGVYLAYVGMIGRAAGWSGRLARLAQTANLQDRCLHPRVRADGSSPPYARGLALLTHHSAAASQPGGQIASAHARSPVLRPNLAQGTGREVLFAQVDRLADAR
jgi:hypothetical protein